MYECVLRPLPTAVQVLRRAPALRHLSLGSQRLELLAALRSNQTLIVRDELLAPGDWVGMSGVHRTALLDLLWRSRAQLRSLVFPLEDASMSATDSEGRTGLQVFAQLRALKDMRLTMFVSGGHAAYAGELAGAMPDLQELRVRYFEDDHWSIAAIADLVRTAAASLRVLLFECEEGESDEVLGCVAACVNVERLRVGADEIPTLAAVRGLKKLTHLDQLYLYPYERGDDADNFEACLKNVERLCVVELPALQSIRLRIYHSDEVTPELRALCRRSEEAVRKLRPALKVSFNPA